MADQIGGGKDVAKTLPVLNTESKAVLLPVVLRYWINVLDTKG
jgi:hypothetical protein